ncbi:MAG: GntR family transcriptional regulator [Bacillota bacterium]
MAGDGQHPGTGTDSADQVRGQVHGELRRALLEGRYEPGDRLVERKLAAELGVSRTPVREALRALEQEGLVYHMPRSGAVVARLDSREVQEIYRIRAVLEGLAARMAAERIGPRRLKRLESLLEQIEDLADRGETHQLESVHREFNHVIYRAAESPRLYDMVTSMADYIDLFVRVGYAHPGRLTEATDEHRRLVAAIRLRDGDLAEHVAREHVNRSRHAYLQAAAQKKKGDSPPFPDNRLEN